MTKGSLQDVEGEVAHGTEIRVADVIAEGFVVHRGGKTEVAFLRVALVSKGEERGRFFAEDVGEVFENSWR